MGTLLVASLVAVACSEPTPPNVLVYVVDTLRADSLESYGHPLVKTPAIVRLTEEGVLYSRAYAHSSWTRPSVASILTGLPPDIHGVETRDDVAPEALHLLSERLRDAGYATAAFVTNPNVGRYFGFDQGYDEFVELFFKRKGGVVKTWDARSRSNVVTERVIEWIAGAKQPFFLFVLTTDPHWPYEPPPDFNVYGYAAGRSFELGEIARDRSRYYGEVAFSDDSFGRLVDSLRAGGLYENTALVLTSDHGEEFGDHGGTLHGRTLYEEMVWVPLIVHRPGEDSSGTRVETPARLLDLVPTLLHIAGVPIPSDLPGRVLPPDGDDPTRTIYARLSLEGRVGETLIDFPWKLITGPTDGPGELVEGGLFHLDQDPQERRDLRQSHRERVRDMTARLEDRARENAARRVSQDASGSGELPDDVREGLEALGYIDGEPDSPDH